MEAIAFLAMSIKFTQVSPSANRSEKRRHTIG